MKHTCKRCTEATASKQFYGLCPICFHLQRYEERAAKPPFSFARKAAEWFGVVTIRQAEKGYAKYGEELDAQDAKHDWIDMTEQEFADGWQYLQCAKEERERMRKAIEQLTAHNDYLLARLQRAEKAVNLVRDYAVGIMDAESVSAVGMQPVMALVASVDGGKPAVIYVGADRFVRKGVGA